MKSLLLSCATFIAILYSPVCESAPPFSIDESALLRKLVSVSSGTATHAGVNQVQEEIAAILRTLGFTVELGANPAGAGKSGTQLVATRIGSDAAKRSRFITLVSHADTVFETLNPYEVSADGKIARGSGVADDKGGVVVGLGAVAELLKSPNAHSLRFVVSPSEETGSTGFETGLRRFTTDSIAVLGLEPARENGNIIRSRKGIRWYEITVAGKEAHAGVSHHEGVNACHQLAITLDRLQRLTDYQKGTTVNIGRMEGGKKGNIVCGNAQATIDVRYRDAKNGRRLFEKMERILAESTVKSQSTGEKARITSKITVDNPPLVPAPGAEKELARYLSFIREIEGRTVQAEDTGGASDLNFMADGKTLFLDGLGPVGGGYHTDKEFVDIASLRSRASVLARFLRDLDQR
ncbi:MAG: M20/M25/M40 family metallo-hydrolase [Proteobacteria bacterium]|nr:M20/M25/M40 family metallo-hydrolase [Pseudomonadota bacterium]